MNDIKQDPTRRLMLFYERRNAAAWLAHLDTMRLFERAFSRADWPVAFSVEAFNPRPMIVFALPVGIGVETRRDPVEVVLIDRDQSFDVEKNIQLLNDSLPSGVRIVDGTWVENVQKSPMARVKAASYRIEAPGVGEAFLKTYESEQEMWVTRVHKKKKITVDLRPRIFSVLTADRDLLELTGGAGSADHLRIDLLLDALCRDGGLSEADALGARITRTRVFLDADPREKGIIVEMA